MKDVVHDWYSNSARSNQAGLLKTWTELHVETYGDDVPVVPLSPSSLAAVAAVFKGGHYRSFANYSSAAKTEHVEAGYPWTSLLEHVVKWCSRSVTRGIGPARQCLASSLHGLLEMEPAEEPVVVGGCMWPLVATLLAIVVLLREIELALAAVGDWTFDDVLLEVSWRLPVSKSDPRGRGTTRT